MSLTTGTKLGPYEILDLIGAGGMGEVYRARDTRLDRIVALKVSKDQFSERFDREARSVAALNHPNICALYDVGPNYLVMEFVAGENLAGPLPLETAVGYARQIAEAIEAAHEKGIVHRDLKPANVKVTPEGNIKVLDFGLAKALSDEPVPGSMQNSPTLSMAMTQAGMILGTAAYMSPEQAKGKPADRRADIWAFGVVFYEMLAGGQTFSGETAAETLASVLKETISFDRLPADTPPAIRLLLARCLERDVRKRLQAIGEARIMLEGPMPVGDSGTEVPLQAEARSTKTPWAIAGVLALALAGLAAWTWWPRPKPVEVGAVHFIAAPPEGATLTGNNPSATQVSVSPDGHYVAFIADESGRGRTLWVRALGSLSAQQLDRTEGARFPFWSPDSQTIAFFTDGKLKRIPVSGGTPLVICDAPNPDGGTWNREGVIVFAPDATSPLHRVPAAGGVSTPVTTLDKTQQETAHIWPQFLPDGQRFLYWARGAKGRIYVQSLGSSQRTFLLATPGRAVFASGFLLFLRDNTLLAQHLDLRSLRLEGEPVSVAEDVRSGASNGRNGFSISENGVLAYRPGGSSGNVRVSWYTREGKPAGTALPAGDYPQIELSPDDKRLVVERAPSGSGGSGSGSGIDLWLLDLATGVFSRLTSGPDSEQDPLWSPDSHSVIYTVPDGKEPAIRQVVIGAADTPVFADGKANQLDDWSRDGKLLVYHIQGGNDISILPLSGDRKPKVVFQTTFQKNQVRLSPDGRWVAYMSLESGQPEVYLAAFPSFTDRRQVSAGGGLMPRWQKDGRELYYIALDRRVMAVEIKAGSTLETGAVKQLFQLQPGTAISSTGYTWAVTGDGQKFLIQEPAGAANAGATEPIHIVIDWPAGLGR